MRSCQTIFQGKFRQEGIHCRDSGMKQANERREFREPVFRLPIKWVGVKKGRLLDSLSQLLETVQDSHKCLVSRFITIKGENFFLISLTEPDLNCEILTLTD